MRFTTILKQFDYRFPLELIAQKPASPRDSARLLVFNRTTKKKTSTTFRSLPNFLPSNALLVFNETKVIPARIHVTKKTGGAVALLYLKTDGSTIRCLANKSLKEGEILTLSRNRSFRVTKRSGKEWILKPSFPIHELASIMKQYGSAPLPPYIKHSPLTERERRREYQTIFAKHAGSIAAPTASLHFTKRLMSALKKRGIGITFVTLHVHLGTFAPLTEEQWKKGMLHTEEYAIPASAKRMIERAKKEKRPIIAIGTTVVRTLESASNTQKKIIRTKGSTDLFIREGYTFTMIDGLITNFHVPRSSLLMLVSAFAGRETIMELYRDAIQKRYRLFSFGDGMLIV